MEERVPATSERKNKHNVMFHGSSYNGSQAPSHHIHRISDKRLHHRSQGQTHISSKPGGVTNAREENHPQFLMQHKSQGNVDQKEQERRIHKRIKQVKELGPLKRHLVRKHTSSTEAPKSEKPEKFSKNVIGEQPVKHRLMQHDKNKIHKREVTPQHSSLSKTLHYNEENEMQEQMSADCSESEESADTHPQTGEDFFSTSFTIMLPLAILASVLYRAISTISNPFLFGNKIANDFSYTPLTSQNQYVATLLGWGVLGCPILAGLVLLTQCSFQPRVFLMVSTALYVITMSTLLLLQLPNTFPNYGMLNPETGENKLRMSLIQR
jgi:hypothetical protein